MNALTRCAAALLAAATIALPVSAGLIMGRSTAAPKLDTTPVSANFQAAAAGICPSITTTGPNKTIFIASNIGRTGTGSAPTVSFVNNAGTDTASLTWAVLGGSHNSAIFDNTAGSLSGLLQSAVIYWAAAPSAGTYTPRITWNTNADAGIVICWALSGANTAFPQDPNASIAVTAGGSTAPPVISGYSTTTSTPLLIFYRTAYQTVACNGTTGQPAGWTLLKFQANTGGATNFACGEVDYLTATAAQSALTITSTNTGTAGRSRFRNWVAIGTAIVP